LIGGRLRAAQGPLARAIAAGELVRTLAREAG
jgi:hypothetical protein